jgi:hypothetical protein
MDMPVIRTVLGKILSTYTDMDGYGYAGWTYYILIDGRIEKRRGVPQQYDSVPSYPTLQDVYDEGFRQKVIHTLSYNMINHLIRIPDGTRDIRAIEVKIGPYSIRNTKYLRRIREWMNEWAKIRLDVTSLSISMSTQQTIPYFSEILTMFPNVTSLVFKGVNISAKESFVFRDVLPRLISLTLSNVSIKTEDGWRSILCRISKILKNAPILSSFSFDTKTHVQPYGHIVDLRQTYDFKCLARAIKKHGNLENIKITGFPYARWCSRGWDDLVIGLRNCRCLRLKDVLVDKEAALSLCGFLQQRECHIHTLDIQRSRQFVYRMATISDEAFAIFGKTCLSWNVSRFKYYSDVPMEIQIRRPDLVWPFCPIFWTNQDAFEWVKKAMEQYPHVPSLYTIFIHLCKELEIEVDPIVESMPLAVLVLNKQ